eukprot:sb/3469730/
MVIYSSIIQSDPDLTEPDLACQVLTTVRAQKMLSAMQSRLEVRLEIPQIGLIVTPPQLYLLQHFTSYWQYKLGITNAEEAVCVVSGSAATSDLYQTLDTTQEGGHVIPALLSLTVQWPHEPYKIGKQPIRTRYLGHVNGYQPIRNQYFLIRSVPGPREPYKIGKQPIRTRYFDHPVFPDSVGREPIRTRYLGHVTAYQPIIDQYFLYPCLLPPHYSSLCYTL